MRTRSFKLVLILLTSAAVGRSQPAPAAPAASTDTPVVAAKPADVVETAKPADAVVAAKPAEGTATVQTTEPSGAGASRNKDTLSVDFPDEDIRTILRNVADLFELNLVVPAALQGKTSVKLHDVTWRQVFDVVLTPVGYTYVDENGIIKIVSLESLAEEPVIVEVFVLSYAKASEVQASISTLVDTAKGGKLTLDARSNSLIISEHPSKLNKIRPIIKLLDKATDQVMIESKFGEVTTNDMKNIGIDWSSLNNYTVGAANLSQTYTNTSGRTSASAQNIADGKKLVPLYTMTPNYPYLASSTDPNDFHRVYTAPYDASIGYSGALSRVTSAVFSADQFKVILSALITQNMTKVVSNPTVVTLNNSEAVINVGEEDPIPNYTYNQEHGSFEVSGFTYKPIGIILKVTPQVNAAGFIKLNIEPEVSQKNGTVNFGGAAGAEIPIIATRKAKTQVSMKDGYTMAIGGLIRTQTVNSGSKVPFLGSIPLIGHLFSSSTKSKDVNNLIIFITAKTVNAEGATPEQIISPEQIRGLDMRREDLPGYRVGPDPFLPLGAGEKAAK